MSKSNGKKNGKSKVAGKKIDGAEFSARGDKGEFTKGAKPGPGRKPGALLGMRMLLARFDERVKAAIERGDVEEAETLFYAQGRGTGFIAMLREYKRLGVLDAMLAEAAVPEKIDVTIVIGEDRKVESPPGVDPFPIEERMGG